jgi:AcrR family transcriptional regulator
VGGARRIAALEAAVCVIAERGYERVRFSDVAEESGTAVSTLQYYFGSREDMILEAFRHATEGEVASLKGAAEGPDPWVRLAGMVEDALAWDEEAELGWRVMLEYWRAATRDGELREESLLLYERWREPFLGTIVEGVDSGVFRPRRDPEVVVTHLFATIDGIAAPVLLGYPQVDLAALRDAMLEDLAYALGVDTGTGARRHDGPSPASEEDQG